MTELIFSRLENSQLGDEACLRADSWWKDRAPEPLDRSWRPLPDAL